MTERDGRRMRAFKQRIADAAWESLKHVSMWNALDMAEARLQGLSMFTMFGKDR